MGLSESLIKAPESESDWGHIWADICVLIKPAELWTLRFRIYDGQTDPGRPHNQKLNCEQIIPAHSVKPGHSIVNKTLIGSENFLSAHMNLIWITLCFNNLYEYAIKRNEMFNQTYTWCKWEYFKHVWIFSSNYIPRCCYLEFLCVEFCSKYLPTLSN